jgi:transposase
MSTSTTFIGLDAHKETIVAAILYPRRKDHEIVELANTEQSLRRFVRSLRKKSSCQLRACYEAGPLGFGLMRQLAKLGVETSVIAPSKIPSMPGDRVKTDRRDAKKLADLFRAGLLTEVHPPSEEDEAVRDLCRARQQAKESETAAKHRLNKFLTRRNKSYDGKSRWTIAFWEWLDKLTFKHEADRFTFDHYVAVLKHLAEQIAALDAKIEALSKTEPYETPVAKLRCFRGIDTTSAMVLVTELHGFDRFESAPQLMAFVGLTPSEYSSAGKRQQGSITKAGNAHVRRILVEVAWNYRHAPRVGTKLRARRAQQSPRTIETADKAMRRLYARWRKMDERRKPSQKIVVAAARELMGFVWAALADPPNKTEAPPPKKKIYKLPTKAR